MYESFLSILIEAAGFGIGLLAPWAAAYFVGKRFGLGVL